LAEGGGVEKKGTASKKKQEGKPACCFKSLSLRKGVIAYAVPKEA